jgi:hypothetical protein
VQTALLFLDECMSEYLDLAALTGVLVPAERYAAVRDDMCSVVWQCMDPPKGTLPPPIELHANSLLNELTDRDATELDQARLQVFASAVRIINTHRLGVYRVAYTNRSEIESTMHGDPNLYGVNFFGMQTWLAPILADTLVVPVMDGIPDSSKARKPPSIDPQLIRSFSASTRWIHHYRASGGSDSNLSIAHPINLAEPVYADSTHSTLLQLVDLVSYLLHQIDKDELGDGRAPSLFGTAMLAHARRIDQSLVKSWRGQMHARRAL